MNKTAKGRFEFQAYGLKVQIVPFSDSLECGYIRFENSDGKYVGSMDHSVRITSLKKLRTAIDQIIKRKQR